MDNNMRAELCEKTIVSVAMKYGKTAIKGLIAHSDYTEENTMPSNTMAASWTQLYLLGDAVHHR